MFELPRSGRRSLSERTLVSLLTLLFCLVWGSPGLANSYTVIDEFRALNGDGNNLDHPSWGRADTPLLRQMMSADYEDGVREPRSEGLPSPREISNAFPAPRFAPQNATYVSDFFWQWGQFLDHDIDLTGTADPEENFDIPIPTGDPFFDPQGTGGRTMRFMRSNYSENTGVREQINEISAFIDASQVYGVDLQRAAALRTMDGTGRLATSTGEYLPYNTDGHSNAPNSEDPSFFLAGDIRANEQAALTAMHTLFVREHNYQVERIRNENPELDGDLLYEFARAIVGAEMQAITFREFLPTLLGPEAIPDYAGYDDSVNPGIENAFSTMAYRFGHSMLSPQLLQLEEDGQPILQGPYPLRSVFFSPQAVTRSGIEPFLRGLAAQPAQAIDPFVVDDVRNFLFGSPGNGGLDLTSLNIQRGRDHGTLRYNVCRSELGLSRWTDMSQVSSNPEILAGLRQVYETVDDVDGWVGALAEPPHGQSLVGETNFRMIREQFLRLRDGDRFWYQNYLTAEAIEYVEAQTLATIIRRNTSIENIQANVFIIESPAAVEGPPSMQPREGWFGPPFPNPARDGAMFKLEIPSEISQPVKVELFDARGRLVRVLQSGLTDPGTYTIRWDRTDRNGERVAAGFYFARATSEFGTTGQKLVIRD